MSKNNLVKLQKWVDVHTNLLNYFQPANLGFSEKLLNSKQAEFVFEEKEKYNPEFMDGMFLNWLGLYNKLPGSRVTIAQHLKTNADRVGLSQDEKLLLNAMLSSHWSFYQVSSVNKKLCTYTLTELWSEKEYKMHGRNASKVYENGFVVYTIPLEIDGIAFSIGTFSTPFKPAVIESIKYFLKDSLPVTNWDKKMELKTRKVAFELSKIGGALGIGSKKNKVYSMYDLEKAIKRVQKEFHSKSIPISKDEALNFVSEILTEQILNEPDFKIMGKTLKELSRYSEHHSLVMEVIELFCSSETLGNHGRHFYEKISKKIEM